MTEITAYHSATAPWFREWIAYVVLSDGKLWGVYATGATEEAAKAKIVALWESETSKYNKTASSSWDNVSPKQSAPSDPWGNITPAKEHHFANKVWMRHKVDRNLVRVPLTEITMYEGMGYERSGPRSK